MSWGYHLTLDCVQGTNINDKEYMKLFIQELVSEIDMVAFGEPWIERFATHDPTKAGISFCQMIETSNICGHFVEETGDFYIDVFSCKPFKSLTVLEVVKKYFSPKKYKYKMVERDARS